MDITFTKNNNIIIFKIKKKKINKPICTKINPIEKNNDEINQIEKNNNKINPIEKNNDKINPIEKNNDKINPIEKNNNKINIKDNIKTSILNNQINYNELLDYYKHNNKKDHNEPNKNNNLDKKDHNEPNKNNNLDKKDYNEINKVNILDKKDHNEINKVNKIEINKINNLDKKDHNEPNKINKIEINKINNLDKKDYNEINKVNKIEINNIDKKDHNEPNKINKIEINKINKVDNLDKNKKSIKSNINILYNVINNISRLVDNLLVAENNDLVELFLTDYNKFINSLKLTITNLIKFVNKNEIDYIDDLIELLDIDTIDNMHIKYDDYSKEKLIEYNKHIKNIVTLCKKYKNYV